MLTSSRCSSFNKIFLFLIPKKKKKNYRVLFFPCICSCQRLIIIPCYLPEVAPYSCSLVITVQDLSHGAFGPLYCPHRRSSPSYSSQTKLRQSLCYTSVIDFFALSFPIISLPVVSTFHVQVINVIARPQAMPPPSILFICPLA